MRERNLKFVQDTRDPTKVAIVAGGKLVGYLPWELADEANKALHAAARKCEEYAKAHQIIVADSLLIRTGAPFSFTSNPRIREESFSRAQWDSAARKAMRLAARPSPKPVGRPRIVKA